MVFERFSLADAERIVRLQQVLASEPKMVEFSGTDLLHLTEYTGAICLKELLENPDYYRLPKHAGGLEPASLSAPDTHLPNTMPITHNEWPWDAFSEFRGFGTS